MNENNRANIRKRTVHVRYSSPSRAEMVIVICQIQDAMGRWMVPTITTSGIIPQIIESGRFAKDLGSALIVSSYFFDVFMTDVLDHDTNS